jgi:hypothetical protein
MARRRRSTKRTLYMKIQRLLKKVPLLLVAMAPFIHTIVSIILIVHELHRVGGVI